MQLDQVANHLRCGLSKYGMFKNTTYRLLCLEDGRFTLLYEGKIERSAMHLSTLLGDINNQNWSLTNEN